MRQDSHLSFRTIVLYTEEEDSSPPVIWTGKIHVWTDSWNIEKENTV